MARLQHLGDRIDHLAGKVDVEHGQIKRLGSRRIERLETLPHGPTMLQPNSTRKSSISSATSSSSSTIRTRLPTSIGGVTVIMADPCADGQEAEH